jgi:membrane protease YdiL (CAAX protease family)
LDAASGEATAPGAEASRREDAAALAPDPASAAAAEGLAGSESSATRIARRFCPRCGDTWLAGTLECAACVVRHRSLPADLQPKRTRWRLSLTLYFVLLGSFFVAVLGQGEMPYLLAMQVVDSGVVLAFCIIARRDVIAALRWRGGTLLWCGAGAAMGFATFGLATGLSAALRALVGVDEARYADEYLSAGLGWTIIILSVCVQPAVIEELAFRGVIFSSLRETLSPFEAILVSSVMFMVIHLMVPMFPFLLVIGLMLGWLRHRTGSMYPGIALHFTHNLLVVLVT